jgi:formylglycine-generating enzyme required for sulfatase activity
MVRRAVLLGVWLAACVPQVDYSGTEFLCPDGVTCPDGFSCVAGVCRDEDEPPPGDDAGVGGMVAVAAGPFLRGCNFVTDVDCNFDAVPQATIELSAFEIDVHEVTQAEYQRCIDGGDCVAPAADFDPAGRAGFPVTQVSFDDAAAYCEHVGKRLPSEAEWEKAARGTDGRSYPWGDSAPECARVTFAGCGGEPQATASHVDDESPFGSTEMAGNVAEWVADRYSASYYSMAPAADPPGPTSGNERVVRGGSYASDAIGVSTFVRDHAPPATRNASTGFRCAR